MAEPNADVSSLNHSDVTVFTPEEMLEWDGNIFDPRYRIPAFQMVNEFIDTREPGDVLEALNYVEGTSEPHPFELNRYVHSDITIEAATELPHRDLERAKELYEYAVEHPDSPVLEGMEAHLLTGITKADPVYGVPKICEHVDRALQSPTTYGLEDYTTLADNVDTLLEGFMSDGMHPVYQRRLAYLYVDLSIAIESSKQRVEQADRLLDQKRQNAVARGVLRVESSKHSSTD